MLSLVIPTFNEAESLPLLLPRIAQVLRDIPHEVIVVDDDSPDGTWRKAEELKKTYPRLIVIRRKDERGLSSAVIAGFKAARGEVLAVMDADGQHDTELLRQLYETVRARRGIAVASRYIPGGGTGQWKRSRTLMSRGVTRAVTMFCQLKVHDPMSGFFAMDRSLFERIAPSLPRLRGFKVLFDLLMRVPTGTPLAEVPYTFTPRMAGRSKLSIKVQWDFGCSLIALFLERWSRAAWAFFLILLIGLTCLLSIRAWNLRLLVTDAAVRARTSEAFRSLSKTDGWLTSDLLLRKVDPERLELLYAPHDRSGTNERCIRVRLDYFGWYPCDAS